MSGDKESKEMSVESETKESKSGGFSDTIRVVIHALLLALVVRVFFYQPFNIPSGSMIGKCNLGFSVVPLVSCRSTSP